MNQDELDDLEKVYADWEEAEMRFAHENSVWKIIDALDEHQGAEQDYQLLRLKYSPAYFSGHPFYCGERLNACTTDFAHMIQLLCMQWAMQGHS